ncbi:peroxidase-related enzyme, partial [mine drainage metagenome]
SGFSDDEVWDISAVVALFALANRMALALDMRPNEEFHLLGRVSKQE